MFRNIGGKIKGLAKFICWLGIIASVVSGFVVFAEVYKRFDNIAFSVVAGILLMIVGSLVSWIGSFTLYGFGQLVDNSDIIANQKENREN